MDRAIVEPLEQLKALDVCRTNLFAMIGLGKLTKAILGSGPFLNDLGCLPDSPASLKVFLQPGEIYMLEDIDTTAYGPIPADTTNQIVKQGILLDPQEFTLTPPATPGNSINYLIQAIYSDSDTDIENRPFFNQPAQNIATVRSGILSATLKAGTAAPTGSQTTPAPDAGYVGAWVVTVANGQTQIIAGDINKYPNAPFIVSKLGDKLDQTSADARYGQITQIQSGAYLYAQATGTANALVSAISPNITSLYEGMEVHIKISATNTGAATLNLNGLGVKNIISKDGNALVGGELLVNTISILSYDGAEFILQNPSNKFLNTPSGYTYLAGGLILQWGKVNITANSSTRISTPVTLPIPFTTSTYVITTSYNDSNPALFDSGLCTLTNNQTNSGFDFIVDQGATVSITKDVIGNFIAIGK